MKNSELVKAVENLGYYVKEFKEEEKKYFFDDINGKSEQKVLTGDIMLKISPVNKEISGNRS